MANFVFLLTNDRVEPATRCFQFAKVAHSKGHKVDLFFVDDAVFWADKTRDFSTKCKTGDCPNDYFPYLVENEIQIGICPPCANARQMDEAKFFPNMILAGGPYLIDLVAEGKLFTF